MSRKIETFGERVSLLMKAFTISTVTLVIEYKKDNLPSGTLIIKDIERDYKLRACLGIRRIANDMGYSIIITELNTKTASTDYEKPTEI